MFVCLGNICRSPLAHGILEDRIRKAGLQDRFEIASSGIGDWHIGEKPDSRMRRTAQRHGLSLDYQRAQQLTRTDLTHYDHLYSMDRRVQRDTERMAPSRELAARVQLFRMHDPEPNLGDVPDPWFENNFDEVYTIVDRTCTALLEHLVRRYGLTPGASAGT